MAGLVRRLAAQPAAADEPRQALTAREREVLRLLAEGETNPGIANRLIISRATVKAHVEHIIRKMGVSDRTQAAVRAVQLGLTQPS
jgi:DNA-binding NarL/FixJ family response regulator